MAATKQKTEVLFHYYLQNGFNHTIEEIIEGLHVSHKTFFNRYQSKEHSVAMVCQYWHSIIKERFREKMLECNHAVEELLNFVYEVQSLRKHEKVLFQYENAQHLFVTEQTPLMDILSVIIDKGIRHYQFEETVNKAVYSQFFIQNLCDYLPYAYDQELTLRYLLLPLLSERGRELLDEMNLESFLIK
ncbi:MAG: hypothetical protein MJZ57_00925 [Bacteroidales bacterium]|nr:hypothetical protein [Bacteroidales bacterium]